MKKELLKTNSKEISKAQRVYLNPIALVKKGSDGLKNFLFFILVTVISLEYLEKKEDKKAIRREIASIHESQKLFEERLIEKLKEQSLQSSISGVSHIEQNIINHINRLELAAERSKKVAKGKDLELSHLRKKLSDLLSIHKAEKLARKDRTLLYNRKNYDILSFKHRQELKRFRQKQAAQEEAFLALHDIDLPENQKMWADFKDSQELEYYKRERSLEAERRQFRERKFTKLNSKL